MNLKDFVKDSITQIIDGVTEAEKIISQKEAHVNPTYVNLSSDIVIPRAERVHMLKFNVAVTEAKEASANAGGKMSTGLVGVFLGISASAGGEISKGSENLSRIEFEIPIAYPLTKPEPIKAGKILKPRV